MVGTDRLDGPAIDTFRYESNKLREVQRNDHFHAAMDSKGVILVCFPPQWIILRLSMGPHFQIGVRSSSVRSFNSSASAYT